LHKLFRMRSSEKSAGMGYSRRSLSPNSFPCHTSENSLVSEHAERMRVPSDHRESMGHSDLVGRDLTGALNPLTATLAENHLVSPITATLPKSHSCKSFPCHRSETPGGNLASAANLKVYALSLAGACEPAWAYLPMLSFQLSIEDPDPVGTVDCQPPVPPFHRSLSKESFTTLLHSIAFALFLETAGCAPTLGPKLRLRDRVGTNSRPRRGRVIHR